jgi:hypothetical protein
LVDVVNSVVLGSNTPAKQLEFEVSRGTNFGNTDQGT